MMQFVATIGRNDPCPCQSGKKYKKCCLPVHEARAAEQRRANEQRSALDRPDAAALARALAPRLAFDDDDGLTDLSNSAVKLANEGRLDEALAVCARLLTEFPDVVDGLERSAMVHAKMGHHALAADFYRQAFDFVNDQARRDDYEEHDYYREQAEKQQRLADTP
ncbi:MAG: SEC-C metal-binding domain-containing protein [Myxococcota bacterium]|nr:SEC-C metal-binding domain-containing protein [Myxococcota bacterium]